MNITIKTSIPERKGAALVLVMFIVTLLIMAGMGLLFMSYQSRLLVIRTSEDMASRICADAGMVKAINALNTAFDAGTLNDDALPVSIGETLPESQGAFSYKIIKNDDGDYVAVSVGARGPCRRVILATLDRTTKSYFEHGVLSRGAVNIAPNMTALAYDSQDPTATGLKIQMGTLSTNPTATVVTKPGSHVEGDLFCGVGGDPGAIICMGGTQNGSNYALTEEPDVVQPQIPGTLPVFGGTLQTNGTTVTLTPASSGVYSNFCINSGGGNKGTFIIDGGTVTLGVTNFMKFDTNCEIIVKEGATLIMYIACGISAMNGSGISYEGSPIDPTHIQLYGTGTGTEQIWALKAKSTWTGIVYAPNANVSLAAGGDVYGAIMANNAILDIQDGYAFRYDVNLQRSTNIALNGPAGYVVKRWSESSAGEVPDWAY